MVRPTHSIKFALTRGLKKGTNTMSQDKDDDVESDEVDEEETTKQSGDEDENASADDDGGDKTDDEGTEDDEGDDEEEGDADEDQGAEDEGDEADDGDTDELREKLRDSNQKREKLFIRLKEKDGFVPKMVKVKGKLVMERDSKGRIQFTKKGKPQGDDKTRQTTGKKKDEELSSDDLYSLMDAKVPREDVQDVRDYAKLKGLSIAEALQTNFVKSFLAENAEERDTESATHSGQTRRGTRKASGRALMDRASKTGELPQSEEDMRALAEESLKS